MSLNYVQINARATNLLLSVKKHMPSIDDGLKAMIELRVSQINGCAYCVDLHSTEARKAGVPQQKLDCLSVAAESGLFSEAELAALTWAECVTAIANESDLDSKLNKLLEYYSEAQAVDLTLIVSVMNCLNRLSISFSDKPEKRS